MKIQLSLPLMLLLIIAVHTTDCPAQERDRIDSLNNYHDAPPTETSSSISDWMMEYSAFEPQFVTYQNNTQQKLYVQTDKSFYSAGEKIWFTGFLVESIGHIPVILDQYINVDLYSPDGLIVTNQIIRRDSTGFNGSITLPPDLQEGHYILRAYSQWMVESAPDFLFHKTIRIGNKILTDIQTEIAYEKQPDANRRMKIRFIRNNKEPMNKKKIRCELFSDNKPDKTFTLRTDKEAGIEFDLPKDTDKTIKRVDKCTIDEEAIELRRRFVIPPADFDYDVS
ncbi:MAG: MG2 domain-containing protein [Bacteroidales bacterium]